MTTNTPRTVLISGANKGLGLEATRRLIADGHTVYAGMRDLATGDAARGLGAHAVQLDVTDDTSVAAAIAQLPALDVLINNAGITGSAQTLDDLTPEKNDEVFATNVTGVIRVSQAALPLLRESQNPVIVNVASGLGFPRFLLDDSRIESHVMTVPYVAAKAAVIALTVQYAKNLPGMRVNAVDPGYTATDLNGHSGPQTVTEGTDAMVAMANIAADGPTGQFFDRDGRIAY
ncbi:NAD(P)-dependent dehydrogenase (short-subunit alcohol dehydrogenase family) [Labedella gwakjiensis]|uniref:NAD(P)-dependent dehydrogenase (Short-subunit alcohol dehydrogenase family) n=1 Tax=Labedella gwakjiensis TaxID=390269 RepID=A0A2P8GV69_9MICO|nr:SDR family NAD(P)-dependent oxidoreductase [Labedella gwakjiensis]PSL37859.1 NAD(P)-dependent dehydrogenase (short-subunit alcohol dehydrogenase family) [Labedella gwakjiensis]RUQ87570.1 SDR family NAD(P)-dependent oxidoreductase [Labedella gwakjiensis]